ncbi:transcription factor bHLH123-like [Camellia sinensis]|uniref:transcription factor bHLH123-like n=1 Tax=Camellia sinensis TaxID=4442 RepID=UPI00103669E1|nr:transcription factor bHLH123-like [Camellia sinensis]
MADEFQIGSGNNWWESRNRFDSGSSSPSSSSALTSAGSFGWPTEIVDLKPSSSIDSVSVSAGGGGGGGSTMVFQDTNKLQPPDDSSGSGVLADPTLQMMGLGLSSQPMDWNQTLLRGGKAESSFRSMLEEDLSSSTTNFHQETGMGPSQEQWRQKIYSGSSDDSTANEYKQINRGFSLDQPGFSSGEGVSSSFQMDQAGYGSPSTILQGLLGSDSQQQQQQQQQSSFENREVNYLYPPSYGMNSGELLPPWSKFPQFMRNSPPKQPPHGQLQLSNATPFWNTTAAAMSDARSSFFPSLQTQQFSPQTFEEKPKNTSEARDLSTVAKKNSSEASNKRTRSETPSPLPPFKVRKEKMGDRITALQQLVSPFGKTDTASVLSEAIEYIKFLHGQVHILSEPYMKSGASNQHQQNLDHKSKEQEGSKQDLRSRGLCLVPVSSTYPVTHETTVDFWNPTFGGTFR